jgi:hypothetical protein
MTGCLVSLRGIISTGFLLAAAWCLLCSTAQAQSSPIRIPRVTRPPKLDDFVNGTQREAETVVTDFRQYNPHDGAPVSRKTSAYLSYDDKNIYVIFVCEDQPDKIRARMARREDVFNDDMVAVYLDTFHDHQRAYSFSVNPLGVQTDLIATEGQRPNLSFDALWYSEGRLTADGYIVRMAIPFKSLRFPRSFDQTWGIALNRSIIRDNEFSYWPYITPRVRSFVGQMGILEAIENVSPGRNMQFIPYGTLTGGRFLGKDAAGAPGFKTESEARGGLDAKLVVRDAMTIDVALNPDFSQVESDEPQVTINQRFEVFFPEKRPFFLENAGFFQTPEPLLFSRRIIDPLFGVRLTGKIGLWNIGGLLVDDRAGGEISAQGDGRAAIGVVRIQREFAKQSSIGLLATSRTAASSVNDVISLDARLHLDPNWVFSGQLVESYTRQPNASKLSGPAIFAELSHSGRHFNYAGRYLDRSPGFRSELGFIPRVDIRQIEQTSDYRWRPKNRAVASFGPAASVVVNWDRRGRVQDWLSSLGFGIDLVRLTTLTVSRSESFELFQDRGFRKNSTSVTFSTDWFKGLGIVALYSRGVGVNFFPASGLAPFLANSTDGRLGITLRPTPRLRVDQTYVYSRLSNRKDLMLIGAPASASIFNNHLLRSKFNYQFTRSLSLRAILDYAAVIPNSSLVSLERTKRLTADFLATYLVNPGTAVYAGYSDRYDNLALDPTIPATLRRTMSPATSTSRQFFVKLSYLVRP